MDATIGEGAEVATERCCLRTPSNKSVSATTREAVTLHVYRKIDVHDHV